jgi:FtsH-binding integral membrane protein
MQTYSPNNQQGNPAGSYRNNTGNYGYDENYQYDNAYNGQDFMDMDSGFEADDMSMMSGMQNLKSIVAEEVVAKSFLFMVVALLITAGAALTTSPVVAIKMLSGYNFFLLLFAELAIVAVSNWAVAKNNVILAGVLFAVYSYLTGVTCSVLFLIYTGTSMASIFLITALIFGVMAVFGLVTKKDLTSAGNLLMMGLLGIVIAGFVNLFILKSSMFDTVLCAIGILVFVGLTAYDAQKIKRLAAVSNNDNVLTLAMFGAFQLYLDFINLFLKLLRLFGKRK